MKNYWKEKNVLVTGCTGLIGSWLTRSLDENAANVVGLVRDVVPHSIFYRFGLDKKIRVVKGSLEDYHLIDRSINEYEVDTVFHLAAQAIVGTANRNPLSTFETNIRGTWNVLEACRRNKTVKRIVVASSDKAYGTHDSLPYSEEFPLQGAHPYDVSKSCADLICSAYHKTYGLPVSITRCGNIYGGGDLNFNRIIPGTIQSVIFNKNPIIRSDGKFVRDYIYVKDIVNAYLFLAEKTDRPDIAGEAFNFSNDKPIDVIEMVEKILQQMGRKELSPIILNEASNEIRCQYLTSEKARNMLGWKPGYSVDEGLRETVEWYRGYFEK